MSELSNFFSHNLSHIIWGLLVVIAILGVFKEGIRDWVARQLAKREGRRIQEELGSIRTEDELRGSAEKQERLARAKIKGGNEVGVWEIEEIARRKPISNETKSTLARMLCKLDASSQQFADILDILCSTR